MTSSHGENVKESDGAGAVAGEDEKAAGAEEDDEPSVCEEALAASRARAAALERKVSMA